MLVEFADQSAKQAEEAKMSAPVTKMWSTKV